MEYALPLCDCACAVGYYDELTDSDDVSCVLCPFGADCSTPGLTLVSLPVQPGYWRTGYTSSVLSRCGDAASSDTACVGGTITAAASDLCKPWTTGPYCTLCNVTDGSRYYDSDKSSCSECAGRPSSCEALVLDQRARWVTPRQSTARRSENHRPDRHTRLRPDTPADI